MSRSVSFLRRITFKAPPFSTPIWISQANLYEDENRIYAFLTFGSHTDATIERVKIRITPFDENKYGMDPFGIQIQNLGLKAGSNKEHPDPLLLPKGTFAFNFSVVSYGFKKKSKDIEAPSIVTTVASSDGEPATVVEEKPATVVEEKPAEPINEEASETKDVAPSSEGTSNAPAQTPELPKDPNSRSSNNVKPISKMPPFMVALLILLGLAAGFLLLMSGIWGTSVNF